MTEPFRSPNVEYRLRMTEANVQDWVHAVWSDDAAYEAGEAGPGPSQARPANYPHEEPDQP
jgi:hypothetical protein